MTNSVSKQETNSMTWQGLWIGMLWVVLAGFAAMSVVVSFLGARDIKKMLARLAEQASDPDADD